jgi:hemoglobin
MDIKKDIESRDDIDRFIRSFYEKVKTDPTIGIIFTEIVEMDWDHHIPVIVNFWESILLDNPVYKRNAMAVHYDLNKKYPLEPKHFEAWLHLFNDSLDKMFSGKITELAKKRAAGIASLMLFKMTNK